VQRGGRGAAPAVPRARRREAARGASPFRRSLERRLELEEEFLAVRSEENFVDRAAHCDGEEADEAALVRAERGSRAEVLHRRRRSGESEVLRARVHEERRRERLGGSHDERGRRPRRRAEGRRCVRRRGRRAGAAAAADRSRRVRRVARIVINALEVTATESLPCDGEGATAALAPRGGAPLAGRRGGRAPLAGGRGGRRRRGARRARLRPRRGKCMRMLRNVAEEPAWPEERVAPRIEGARRFLPRAEGERDRHGARRGAPERDGVAARLARSGTRGRDQRAV
jgi:hypothetical protein